MSVNITVLVQSKDCEIVQTVQKVSQNARTIIDKCTACNTTGGILTISINLIAAAGGAAASSNLTSKTKSIPAGETYTFPEIVGQYLMPGDSISTIASGSGITLRICGRENT